MGAPDVYPARKFKFNKHSRRTDNRANNLKTCLTGQTSCSISFFKMMDTKAGAIQLAVWTVTVENKYISSISVAIFGLLFSFRPLLRCIGICGTGNGICDKDWIGNWDFGNICAGKRTCVN